MIEEEPLITLRDASALPWMPRRKGRPFRYGTLRSWTLTGIDGIKLEHVMVGTTPCTSEAALRRFFANRAGPDGLAHQTKVRREQHERAEAALERLGI